MPDKNLQIEISEITIHILRKDIKNIYLRVYPPNGKVILTCPQLVPSSRLREFIVSKEGWIRKKISKVRSQNRLPDYRYVDGEIHFIQGKKCKLKIINSTKPRVNIRDDKYLDLYIQNESSTSRREMILNEWYRNVLMEQIPVFVSKWEDKLNVSVREWRVKKMKTRWGSCNIKAKRIWLNLELAKRKKSLLDYVVLHEMVHLKERLHNQRFKSILDRQMPDWRQREKDLQQILPKVD